MIIENKIKKIFIIFLFLHAAIWSTLPLIREILPIDAMECIYWGSLSLLGTNKHPPFAAILAYYTYNIFKTDFAIYLLGQLSIIAGFVYLYKIGKIFFDETKAILSVMIMEACFVYTYMGIYDGFNPNFLLLCFCPAITYYFYKSTHENKLSYWIKLGFCLGLSFISKYQTLMLFLPLFGYLLITENGRKSFKSKGLYIAAAISFMITLPHIIWLYKNDFFSLNYFIICEERYSTFYNGWIKYIQAPFLFLINQLAAVAGTAFVYFTAMFLFNKDKIRQLKNKDIKTFLLCAGIAPLALQTLICINGDYAIPQWGYTTLFMTGILLFYFFPFKISDKITKYMICWSFAAMFITFVVLLIVFATEKNFANRFPVQQVTEKLNCIYKTETNQDIKYLGGFIELTIPLHIYNNKYNVILDTYNHKNIWISEKDLKEKGALIIGRHNYLMDHYIESSVPNLVKKPDIHPFTFTVKNAIGKTREYTMYYAIVPANAEYRNKF